MPDAQSTTSEISIIITRSTPRGSAQTTQSNLRTEGPESSPKERDWGRSRRMRVGGLDTGESESGACDDRQWDSRETESAAPGEPKETTKCGGMEDEGERWSKTAGTGRRTSIALVTSKTIKVSYISKGQM
ncbi:hypothetical protein FPV67DRAFT_1459729 [Lyophyllum atratum]|nr:hypothetical protein FPV67DRAFT_1459729 [Lyophyllum atratum]